MEIMKLIQKKAQDNMNQSAVTIAFLGDSVTQGCFEVYMKTKDTIETIFEREYAYHTDLGKILSVLYPSVPVNIINAGISGDSAPHGAKRLERDVLRYHPDLVVVCFGLNDTGRGMEYIEEYKDALRRIFERLKEEKTEIIFMTPNMMNTGISPHISDPTIRQIAEGIMTIQNGGVMDAYMDAARSVCEECGIRVCDCYKKWKTLEKFGVDTTELLANKINHPSREMNWLFAVSLLETMMED